MKEPKGVQGERVGVVENVEGDPKKFLRVQVRVPDVFGDVPTKDLPWAEYRLPPGSRSGEGDFTPCKVGDHVWVDFPYDGDSRRPRITGSKHYCPNGTPNFPSEAYGERYQKDVVFSQNGITIQMMADGDGVYRITQKATGTVVEIDKTGKVTIESKTDELLIKAKAKITVESEDEVIVKGTMIRLN